MGRVEFGSIYNPAWAGEHFNMPDDDEDSLRSWLMVVFLAAVLAGAFIAWPAIAWKILVSVFK